MAQPQESLILNDGQYNWSRGMDSSRSPMASDPNSIRVGVNVTFRGGRAKTRPGFQQVFLTDDPDSTYTGSLALFSTGMKNGQKTGNYFQGAFFYVNKTNPEKSCIIAVSGGYVFRILPIQGYVARLNIEYNPGPVLYPTSIVPNPPFYPNVNEFRLDGTKRVYFCQAEKFLIIQNGVDRPLIFDGDVLYQSGVGDNPTDLGAINQLSATMPVGTYMAYGQGRLFIASPTKDSFYAGDIVFGGSTNQFDIAYSVPGSVVTVFTNANHGFALNDVVAISGHSSTPNLNGTWRINGVQTNSFNLPTATSAVGIGGYVVQSAEGSEADLLRFTETTFLNEGGSLQIPSQMGQIRGLAFMPTGDTNTGQGDLLVFGEQGVASFAVATPRDLWKTTPAFQRVALSGIGLVSDKTIIPINNDLFFRSLDGIRTYRNARAQQDGYNVTPISTEMDAILDFDTEGLLSAASAVYFDNRLLFTVSPRENYENISGEVIKARPISFQGIGALDFNSLGTSGEKSPAIFDGVWTGCEALQLLTGITNRLPRCFVFKYDPDSNSNQLWENYPWALYDFPLGQSARKIQAALETRSYDFDTPWNLKKLERGDMWIGELAGDTKVNVYYRPDENPCWFPWHTFTTCAEPDTCINSICSVNAVSGFETVDGSGKVVERATKWKLSFKDKPNFIIRIPNSTSSRVGYVPAVTSNGSLITPTQGQPKSFSYIEPLSEINTGFIGQLVWGTNSVGFEDLIAYVLRASVVSWRTYYDGALTAGTYMALFPTVVRLSDLEYTVAWDIRTATLSVSSPTTFNLTYSSTPGTAVALEAPVVLPAPVECGEWQPLNTKDQYRSQLRLPTPSNSCVTTTGTLARVGHVFQFRFEWEGQFSLTKIMFHASKLVEPVAGNCL